MTLGWRNLSGSGDGGLGVCRMANPINEFSNDRTSCTPTNASIAERLSHPPAIAKKFFSQSAARAANAIQYIVGAIAKRAAAFSAWLHLPRSRALLQHSILVCSYFGKQAFHL